VIRTVLFFFFLLFIGGGSGLSWRVLDLRGASRLSGFLFQLMRACMGSRAGRFRSRATSGRVTVGLIWRVELRIVQGREHLSEHVNLVF